MGAIFKFDFQKKESTTFFRETYVTTQKRHDFVCDNYIFHKTRAKTNKQWTHLGALKKNIISS